MAEVGNQCNAESVGWIKKGYDGAFPKATFVFQRGLKSTIKNE